MAWQSRLYHGQEFNSFRRKLHWQEKFLYICDTLDLWEWEIRVIDIQEGLEDDHTTICLGGRGAAPPDTDRNEQHCEVLTIERQELTMETLGTFARSDISV